MPKVRKGVERMKGNYDPGVVKKALEHYKVSGKVRESAKMFGLSHTTLLRYIKRNETSEVFEPNYAVNKVFNASLEMQLKDYILTASKMHYGLTKLQAKQLAYQLAVANDCKFPKAWSDNKAAGEDWLKGFRKRFPELAVRKPEATSLARATAFNHTTVAEFFDNLEKIYQKTTASSTQVYNCDETALTTVHVPPNVLAQSGQKQVGQVTSGERGILITALCFISAAGTTVPPFLIFPRVNFKSHMLNGAPPGSGGAACKSGWMNQDIFLEAMKHFVSHVRPSADHPVVMIYDNHESHVQVELIKFARENHVHILTIPPHTSAKLQPLDVAVYKSLKNSYNAECNAFMLSNPGRTITIYDVSSLFGKAYNRAFSMNNIISGFKATGVWPYNRNVFGEDAFLSSFVSDRPLPGPSAAQDVPGRSETTAQIGSVIQGNVTPGTSGITSEPISPLEIRPFPKAQARVTKPGGRKRGKTTILTATPDKVDNATDQSVTPVKRQLFVDSNPSQTDSETEIEEDYQSETEDSGGDYIEEPSEEDNEDDEEVNTEDIKEGSFVIVKEGIGKGRLDIYSVGQITAVSGRLVTVQYMQPKKNAFVKSEESYEWGKDQIQKILPPPKTGTTKRSSALYYFQYNFSKFGLKG